VVTTSWGIGVGAGVGGIGVGASERGVTSKSSVSLVSFMFMSSCKLAVLALVTLLRYQLMSFSAHSPLFKSVAWSHRSISGSSQHSVAEATQNEVREARIIAWARIAFEYAWVTLDLS